MVENDFHRTFPSKTELENLKVTLFSEFPLSYPGGGERLIRLICDFLRNTNIDARIVENIKNQERNSILEQNSVSNIVGFKFERFGFIKILYQDFPPLKIISNDENAISLIFLRRIPPRSVLRQLESSNSKVIFCLHGIALERIRITNPIIITHQILMRLQLKELARYTRNHIFVQTLTPKLTSYLVTNRAEPKNIFTIENQFESEVNFPERNDEEFQVTYVGRMEDFQKGIKRLKKVVLFVEKFGVRIKFNIIGGGKDSVILKGLDGNARILYGTNDQRKNEIIASSNLGLVTSNLDPYPRVVLEFLTAGVPVITTPVSGPSYILAKEPSFGKVVSFSAKSLAKSIADYYKEWTLDKKLYFSQRVNLYYKARKMFNSKNMLESYRNMILKVETMR